MNIYSSAHDMWGISFQIVPYIGLSGYLYADEFTYLPRRTGNQGINAARLRAAGR